MGTVEPLAREKELELSADMSACWQPVLRSDAGRIEQILLNLLGNAVKFSEEGHVRLAVRCDADGAAFAVTDQGSGIAPEDLPHIFDDFFQARVTASGKHEGTGLGLAVSKRLAEALSGSIVVDSTADAGSTFTLIVPSLAEPRE
jgi:signal transduction histidine kinase